MTVTSQVTVIFGGKIKPTNSRVKPRNSTKKDGLPEDRPPEKQKAGMELATPKKNYTPVKKPGVHPQYP